MGTLYSVVALGLYSVSAVLRALVASEGSRSGAWSCRAVLTSAMGGPASSRGSFALVARVRVTVRAL